MDVADLISDLKAERDALRTALEDRHIWIGLLANHAMEEGETVAFTTTDVRAAAERTPKLDFGPPRKITLN